MATSSSRPNVGNNGEQSMGDDEYSSLRSRKKWKLDFHLPAALIGFSIEQGNDLSSTSRFRDNSHVARGYDLSLDEPFNSVESSPVHPTHDIPSNQPSRVIPDLVSNDVMYNMLLRIDEKLSNQIARMQVVELRIQNVENLLMQRTDTAVWAVEAR
ncbi:Uncharacterized protein TCM_009380 [Theobroma cacao]|uniref:Uncharacterized protein n=1 Tax=Theobroma cacao TaxID=3641 RepID=A0A061ECK0_THECC|nr:Uncharacterized protein TCM_009380 [Theobroma cacao]